MQSSTRNDEDKNGTKRNSELKSKQGFWQRSELQINEGGELSHPTLWPQSHDTFDRLSLKKQTTTTNYIQ